MNEARLRSFAAAYSRALAMDAELREGERLRRARVARAQEWLSPGALSTLTEAQLRELFYDTDAFTRWPNREWEFDRRLRALGLEGLRALLLQLVSKAELGLTRDDLRSLWEARGLGRLLSTELLAYRFPSRYWVYSKKTTLPALRVLGDDVVASLGSEGKSDPQVYLALAPRMLRLRAALGAEGISPADNLDAGVFLQWVLVKEPPPKSTKKAEKEAAKSDEEWDDGVVEETPARPYVLPERARERVKEPAVEEQSPGISVPELLDRAMKSAGLHYARWQVCAFYAALQVKGFVVLSGISGAGKTRLAQRFAEVLPQPAGSRGGLPPDALAVTVLPYMRRYGRLLLPRGALRRFDVPSADEGCELRLTCGEQSTTANLVRSVSRARDEFALVLSVAARGWLEKNAPEGETLVLEPELDQEDLLAGFRMTVAVGLEQTEDSASAEPPKNRLFLPVKPDWHDGRSLLGYFNPLTRTWEWTSFLRFLLRAARSARAGDSTAWFVLLDEMNLAHVEHYFAELLSVLESGRDERGWTREALSFAYPDDAEGALPPRELRLPPSLYFVGTVNTDETTHPLSPKVLDRAFTLEFSDADLRGYPAELGALPSGLFSGEQRKLLDAFLQGGRFTRSARSVVTGLVASEPFFRTRLVHLSDALRPYELHFGYRAFDEMAMFVDASLRQGLCKTLDDAMDIAVLLKVLPRFHGTRGRLEAPLRAFLQWCAQPDEPVVLEAETADGTVGSWKMERCAERAKRLYATVRSAGWASFG